MSKIGQEAASAMSSISFQISVMRCRRTKQVLFVEAGKDFVGTLFSFLLIQLAPLFTCCLRQVESMLISLSFEFEPRATFGFDQDAMGWLYREML